MSVEEQVKELVIKQLKVEPDKVTPEATIREDLGADSLDATELVITIESAFQISIPDEDALRLVTVKDVVEYVEQKVKAAAT